MQSSRQNWALPIEELVYACGYEYGVDPTNVYAQVMKPMSKRYEEIIDVQ